MILPTKSTNPTIQQKELIRVLEAKVGIRFKGSTKQEANRYISNFIDIYKKMVKDD